MDAGKQLVGDGLRWLRGKVSLNKCGFYFEDLGATVKVTVPMEAASTGQAFSKEAASARFDHHGFRLEVALAHTTYVLALPELAGRLRPEECSMRVPAKGSRRVLLQLAKEDASSTWRKLTAM